MTAAKARESLMNMSMGVPLDPTVLQALPRGPINLSSDGNIFEVSIESQSLHINGIAFIPFAVITALHSKLCIHISRTNTLVLTHTF
jgi:hypothetical protein